MVPEAATETLMVVVPGLVNSKGTGQSKLAKPEAAITAVVLLELEAAVNVCVITLEAEG